MLLYILLSPHSPHVGHATFGAAKMLPVNMCVVHSYGRVIGIAKVGYGYIGLHEVGAENFSLLCIYITSIGCSSVLLSLSL